MSSIGLFFQLDKEGKVVCIFFFDKNIDFYMMHKKQKKKKIGAEQSADPAKKEDDDQLERPVEKGDQIAIGGVANLPHFNPSLLQTVPEEELDDEEPPQGWMAWAFGYEVFFFSNDTKQKKRE